MTTAPLKFLALGSPAPWSAFLNSLASRITLQIEPVFTLHQAAARLVTEHPPFRAVLVDPDAIPRTQIPSISILRRHLTIPLLLLPAKHPLSTHAKALRRDLQAAGAIPFDQLPHAAELFSSDVTAALPPVLPIAKIPPATTPLPSPVKPDNIPPFPPANLAEIPVTGTPQNRYDDATAHALSDREMQALLGTAD